MSSYEHSPANPFDPFLDLHHDQGVDFGGYGSLTEYTMAAYDPDRASLPDSAYSAPSSLPLTTGNPVGWGQPTPAIPPLISIPSSQANVPLFDINREKLVTSWTHFGPVGTVCARRGSTVLEGKVFMVNHSMWQAPVNSFIMESGEVWASVLANREIELIMRKCDPPGPIEDGKLATSFLATYAYRITF